MQNSPNTENITTFIWHFVKSQRYVFLLQGLLCLTWSLKESMFPYFIKLIVNNIHMNPASATITVFFPMFALILVWTLMEIAMRIQGLLSAKAFPILRSHIQQYFTNQFKQRDYQWLSKQSHGSLIDICTHIPYACQTLIEFILLHLSSIGGAILISALLLFNAHESFAFLLFAWLTLHIVLTLKMNPGIHQSSIEHATTVSTLSAKVSDIFMNILMVKQYHREHFETDYLNQHQNIEISKAAAAQKQIEYMRIFQGALAIIYMLSMVFMLSFYWKNKLLTLGDIMLVPMLSFSILGMVWWLTQEFNKVYREIGRIRSALNLLNESSPADNDPDLPALIIENAAINCSELSFQYGDKIILNNINLQIHGGQTLGIVGLSGAGKTTFINLLSGILPPGTGTICIDNQDIQTVSAPSLRKSIAVVAQEPILFNRTLRENICYGNLDATNIEMISAAKLALCHDFIMQLPSDYQTIVGDHGCRLSVGQRQRILIARALLSNAPIMIFDEATASLDAITDRSLQKILHNLFQEKTVIIISHRLSTLKYVDRIIVFSEGCITEDGDFASLYHANNQFTELFQQQIEDVSSIGLV